MLMVPCQALILDLDPPPGRFLVLQFSLKIKEINKQVFPYGMEGFQRMGLEKKGKQCLQATSK